MGKILANGIRFAKVFPLRNFVLYDYFNCTYAHVSDYNNELLAYMLACWNKLKIGIKPKLLLSGVCVCVCGVCLSVCLSVHP